MFQNAFHIYIPVIHWLSWNSVSFSRCHVLEATLQKRIFAAHSALHSESTRGPLGRHRKRGRCVASYVRPRGCNQQSVVLREIPDTRSILVPDFPATFSRLRRGQFFQSQDVARTWKSQEGSASLTVHNWDIHTAVSMVRSIPCPMMFDVPWCAMLFLKFRENLPGGQRTCTRTKHGSEHSILKGFFLPRLHTGHDSFDGQYIGIRPWNHFCQLHRDRRTGLSRWILFFSQCQFLFSYHQRWIRDCSLVQILIVELTAGFCTRADFCYHLGFRRPG